MTRSERRLAIRTFVLGALLTLLVVALDFAGTFDAFERGLYDLRVRYCQFFLKKPTDQLCHVDIDNQSIDMVNQFPWPRSMLAQVVDEIRRAGAKALAFDIIFDKEQKPEVVFKPGPQQVDHVIDHDAELTDAIARFHNALVPASFNLEPVTRSPTFDAVRAALVQNLEQLPGEVARQLQHGEP